MNFIHKINQYLIVNHPNIWNTKIVWMLCTSLIIHFFSFLTGWIMYQNPQNLQKEFILNEYFQNGIFLIHTILSILLLVIWLYKMFQNNAFKNYYPVKRKHIFGQFLQFFIIVFVSISFYYSFIWGSQAYINYKYKDNVLSEWKNQINTGAAFLSQNPSNYTLDNRKYPEQLKNLYTEVNKNLVDFSQPHFIYEDLVYQFYTLKTDTISRDDRMTFNYYTSEMHAFTQDFYDYSVVYDKDKVVDLSSIISNANPSYYNYSTVFYEKGTESFSSNYNYYIDNGTLGNADLIQQRYILNKQINDLLRRNDADELKDVLAQFLNIANELKVDHNLTTDEWFQLVSKADNFDLKAIINRFPNNHQEPTYYVYETIEAQELSSSLADIYEKGKTTFYFNSKALKNTLASIDTIRNFNAFAEYIHVFMWISCVFSLLIFAFRMTHLKSFIFAGIALGILSLVVGLFSLSIGFIYPYRSLLICAFVILISCIIVFAPIFSQIHGKKKRYSIYIVLAITTSPLLFFVIIQTIEEIEKLINIGRDQLELKTIIISHFSSYTLSLIVFFAVIVFIYLYIPTIMKWKAARE